MPISNPNPSAKDVVILQRSDNNAFYGETHISGSDLIFYIDSTGHLNADTSASFYSKYPPAATALTSAFASASAVAISASWSSQSLNSFFAVSASWSSQSLSTSFFITHNNPLPVDQRTVVADIAARDGIPLADRYQGLRVWVVSDSQEYTLIGGLNNGFWFATPFSASFATNAYFATTASFALNGGGGGGTSTMSGSNNFVPYWNSNQLTTSSLLTANDDNIAVNTVMPTATTMLTVTEMATSSIIWNPTLLSVVPRFWFRADAIHGTTGSLVDRWPDSSIYKNDATASTSTSRPFIQYAGLNNKPFVTFDGVDDQMKVLSSGSVSSSVVTAFVVARVTNYQPSLTPTAVGTFIGNSHAGNDRDFVLGERFDGGLNHFTWTTYTENVGANFSAETPVLPFEAKTNDWYINSVIVNGSNSSTTLYLSGSASGSGITTLSTNLDLRDLFIGYESASNFPLQGDVAEIIICTASYSTLEYQKVEGYLAWKYGLQGSLVSSHPYKLYPPTASFRGNLQDWWGYDGQLIAYLSSSGLLVATASQAISASWAPPIQSPFATSASYASSSTSTSFAETASYALNANPNAVSASWASRSFSSSFAVASHLADSASWASMSLSSSFALAALTAVTASFATNANPNAVSASWASNSFSSSYAISSSWADHTKSSSYSDTASWAAFAQTLLGTVLSASYAFTASVATTASYALNPNPNAISASWATQSFSSSFALSAHLADTSSYAFSASNAISAAWAPPVISPFATSASYASSSTTASWANSASNAISAAWSPPQTQNTALSASWASMSLSSSYAIQASASYTAVSASWAPTVGISGTDYYLPKWLNNNLTTASNYYDAGPGAGVHVTSSRQIDAQFTVLGGTTASAVLWDPNNAPQPMRVWLVADNITGSQSSSVGLWPDTGSFNNYFTQGTAGNQPKLWTSSLNGHSIVHFSGSLNNYLVAISGSTNIPQSSLCCFAVVRPWTYGASGNAFSTNDVIGNGHSGNSKDFAVGPRVFSGQRQWSMYNESGTSNFDIDAAASLSQSWYIMNGTVNGANSFLTLYIAGAATSSGVVNGSSDMDLRDLYVGYEINFGLPFDGDIAEIIITTQVLSPNDQRKMEGYLAWKYGLQGNLPSDHPYSGSAPYSLDPRVIQSWKDSSANTVAYVSASGLYAGTASWANNAVSASWSPPQGVTAFAISASWASQSLSASYLIPGGAGAGVPGYFPLWLSGSVFSATSSIYQSGSTIGINTTQPSSNYQMVVNGGFAATFKSFMIDHPTQDGKKLCYGTLESPYHGVRLTGRGKIISKKGIRVELPSYIYKLVRPESVNIQLTAIGRGKTFYVDDIDIENNCFYVKIDGKIRKKGYEFFWDFTAVRADVPELVTET